MEFDASMNIDRNGNTWEEISFCPTIILGLKQQFEPRKFPMTINLGRSRDAGSTSAGVESWVLDHTFADIF